MHDSEKTMIRLIITGGTLDKQYNETDGQLLFTRSGLPEMLVQARCTVPIALETLMLKDSLDMSDKDRESVKQTCIAAQEDKIIITHGTDTMVQTARYLAAGLSSKTVVLLGAMIPYRFGNSDALFNLGCAVAAVQILAPGIYITMNGQIFDWHNVHKNKRQGRFQVL